jgi:hypothetical protein
MLAWSATAKHRPRMTKVTSGASGIICPRNRAHVSLASAIARAQPRSEPRACSGSGSRRFFGEATVTEASLRPDCNAVISRRAYGFRNFHNYRCGSGRAAGATRARPIVDMFKRRKTPDKWWI